MRISDIAVVPMQRGTQKWAFDPYVIDAEQQLFDVGQPYYGTYLPQAKMLGQPEFLQPDVRNIFGMGRHGSARVPGGHHKMPMIPQETMFGLGQDFESWKIDPDQPIYTVEGLDQIPDEPR